MSRTDSLRDESWPEHVVLHVEEVCNRFEAECKAGQHPRIEDFLRAGPEAERALLRRELQALASAYGGSVTRDEPLPRTRSTEDESVQSQGSSTAFLERRGQGQSNGAAPAFPTVPGYEILGVLGRGGMGVVYKAKHVQLKRVVALKMILSGSHAGGQEIARFRVEAEAVARLQHPNIVQIYEIGEHDSLPYFSLEFVDGGSLADKLRGTPQPPGAAAALVATLARAMHAAHERGIIHRDLKPANILLVSGGVVSGEASDPSPPILPTTDNWPLTTVPKITDFGLAKQLDSEIGQTRSGAIMGTPSYMAPEQALGLVHEISPRSDVYALGAVLYEMLTGRPPFRGETAMETLLQVTSEEPVPPRRLQPKLPRDLETICLKCLEKASHRRYQSARELAEELDCFGDQRPIRARPVGPVGRLWRWSARNPALAAATGLALAALVAVAAVSLTFGIHRTRAAADLRDALNESEENSLAAQRLSTTLALDRGQTLCEQGEVGPGMLWLARSLEIASRARADDLEPLIRANLAGWRQHLHPVKARLDHPSYVYTVAFSPDGRTALTGYGDDVNESMAQFWDVATLQSIARLPHPEGVSAAAFSPDGRIALTGGFDRMARLWDVATGQLVGQPLEHPKALDAVAFSPDGKTIATGCRDRHARLWDAATRQLIGTPLPHEHLVIAVAFSPDGKTLVTGEASMGIGTNSQKAQLWDVATRKPVGPPLLHVGGVTAVAFSPDGKTVATSGRDRQVQLWDAAKGKPLHAPLTHPTMPKSLAFSPDGGILLTGCQDKTARFWDLAARLPLGAPLQHHGAVTSVAFHPTGRMVLTGCEDGSARLWEAPPPPRSERILRHPQAVIAVAYRPDGRMIATGGGDGVARLWHAGSGQVATSFQHQDKVASVAFSPDGNILATGSWDRTVRLWEVSSGKPLGQPLLHPGDVQALAFSPDGRTLLVGNSKDARFWTVDTGKLIFTPLPGAVLAVAFSSDGRTVATANGDRTVRLWEAATGKATGPVLRHPAVVSAVAFSPDSQTILTGSADHFARLWDVHTGKLVGQPLAQRDWIASVAFSPDGRTLLTGSDQTARFWDVATAKPIGAPLLHHDFVFAVRFSPDGRSVVTGSDDHTARVWDVPIPVEGEPARLILWTQVMTGSELDEAGRVVELDGPGWRERRQRLQELGGVALP